MVSLSNCIPDNFEQTYKVHYRNFEYLCCFHEYSSAVISNLMEVYSVRTGNKAFETSILIY